MLRCQKCSSMTTAKLFIWFGGNYNPNRQKILCVKQRNACLGWQTVIWQTKCCLAYNNLSWIQKTCLVWWQIPCTHCLCLSPPVIFCPLILIYCSHSVLEIQCESEFDHTLHVLFLGRTVSFHLNWEIAFITLVSWKLIASNIALTQSMCSSTHTSKISPNPATVRV